MHPQRVESLSHAQRERLAYIDFRLYFMGEIGRPDLANRFGVAPAGATRDLALYREIAPQNIEFDGSNKIYRIGKSFSPIFEHATQRVLSALALGFGDGVNVDSQPLLPCESPAALSSPRMEVLAPICRAIHAKHPVAIRYHSMTNGESERVIVPFALVDTGLRDVYVRGKYRDVILPFTVLRRLDAVLESTKQAVLERKKFLDTHKVAEQDGALRMAAGQAFYNTSDFTLEKLKASSAGQRLRDDFIDYLDGFSPNVQEILTKFKFRDQIQTLIDAHVLGC